MTFQSIPRHIYIDQAGDGKSVKSLLSAAGTLDCEHYLVYRFCKHTFQLVRDMYRGWLEGGGGV